LAVTQVSEDTLLINPAWVDRSIFGRMKFIEVDERTVRRERRVDRWRSDHPSAFPRHDDVWKKQDCMMIVDATSAKGRCCHMLCLISSD
jgi:hypothetical protein